jgi:hypothetical protein
MAKLELVMVLVLLLTGGVSSSSIGGKPLMRKSEPTAAGRVEVDSHGMTVAAGKDEEESIVETGMNKGSMESDHEEVYASEDSDALDDGAEQDEGGPEEQEMEQEPDEEEQEEGGENEKGTSMLDHESTSNSSGPVNCVWGDWGAWTTSTCWPSDHHRRRSWNFWYHDSARRRRHTNFKASDCQGTKTRTRQQTTQASGGGCCTGEPTSTGACHTASRRRRLGCPQTRRRRWR